MAWDKDSKRGSRQARGYGLEWEKTRLYILARDNHLCQPCLREGRITPGNEVDHIKSKAQHGTDDPENLQTICTDCHKIKTQHEQHGNVPGSTINGEPIDPKHHWNS